LKIICEVTILARKNKGFRRGFRKNKRMKHPTYVIDKQGNVYKYIGITHSPKTNDVENIPLAKNPNPKDNRSAYVRPYVENDDFRNFGRGYNDWKFSEADRKTVRKIIEKNKEKPRK
jgi:hypothetical protein